MATRTSTDQLFEGAYDDLCRIARGLRGARSIPDPAALVHEAYLRFRQRSFSCEVEDFAFVMVLAMKTVARDRRRRESTLKRGGGRALIALEDANPNDAGWHSPNQRSDIRALREVLRRLADDNPQWFATLVHYDFAGRTFNETALQMGVPEAAVRSCRRSALRWLRKALL
jgi:RNA polymerase sigma factor (sigma-70 family)